MKMLGWGLLVSVDVETVSLIAVGLVLFRQHR